MGDVSLTDHRKWLSETLPKHERLTVAVRHLIENMLKERSIEYLSVGSRVKDLDGAIDKISRKQYSDPYEQLTDLSGIRIITFLEQQVTAISKIIRELFDIDDANSLDRTEVLGDDKVGYRSTHFVCTLGKKREKLPEYDSLGDLKFEIQVRTVLQHAWAELAHDRSFKFGTALPTRIQRKLNLHSGMLEIVDSAFDSISREIDDYKNFLEGKTISQIEKIEIDSISLAKFVETISKQHGINFDDTRLPSRLIREIKDAGILNIGQLINRADAQFIEAYQEGSVSSKAVSFLRLLILYHDIKQLDAMVSIKRIWKPAFDILARKHGKQVLERELRSRNIEINRRTRPAKKTEQA